MRGAADGYGGTRDGVVSVGELFEYVRDRVREDTEERQHPLVGPSVFDRRLPMAVTGELDVEQHLALGRQLAVVGMLLDDVAPSLLAARQFTIATDLKRVLPEADGNEAQPFSAGRPVEAATALVGAIASGADLAAEAWLFHGVACAETKAPLAPSPPFAQYCRLLPTVLTWAGPRPTPIGLRVPKVPQFTPFWLESDSARWRHPHATSRPFGGYSTDVFGAESSSIVSLVEDQVTRPAVLPVLEELGRRVTGRRRLVYYMGHTYRTGYPGDPGEAFLLTRETRHGGKTRRGDGVRNKPEELIAALSIALSRSPVVARLRRVRCLRQSGEVERAGGPISLRSMGVV